MNQLTKAAVIAAIASAELLAPNDVEIDDTHVTFTYETNSPPPALSLCNALREAELNFLDPRPETDDVHSSVSLGGRSVEKHTIKIDRMNREQFDKALDEMSSDGNA